MKMKIAVKGGAAVDPDSGNYIISCPFLSREFAHAQWTSYGCQVESGGFRSQLPR